MNSFYRELKNSMETTEGDIWAETVLTGEHAGEKHLLYHDPAAADSPDAGADVFRERIGRTPKLIICGGGHVSMPIIRMGKMLGFLVTVIEDRPRFADNARAAGADQVICDTFGSGLSQIRGDSDSWFIIVTRGHRYDSECLELILQKRSAYVGMMGSRRRVAIVKEQLEAGGIRRELLDNVHTPIGLKIGAETPEEIAVSVMAEIIQVKNAANSGKRGEHDSRTGGYSAEILNAVLGIGPDSGAEMKKVLATIISRKGSAPRGTGTKMLILEDGRTIDTIGGGCIEGQIIQKALLMMRTGTPDFQTCRVDMTAGEAEDEGMVCGGVVEVMLETV